MYDIDYVKRGSGMDIRLLRYFVTVAQEGNITKAADSLFITQPTLSRQLHDLEEYFGTDLFIREKRKISLTDSGFLLYQRAVEILELCDKTEDEMFSLKTETAGSISIALVESHGVNDFMPYIKSFTKEYPNIVFDIYNGYADDIKDRIDKGLTEIGVLMEPVEVGKYDFLRLPTKERWGILAPAESAIAQKKSISWQELQKIPLIIPRRHFGRRALEKAFPNAPENLHIIATYTLFSNVAYMVEEEIGYALCIEEAEEIRQRGKTVFVPLEPEYLTGNVMVWRKNQAFGKSAIIFLNYVRKKLSERSEEIES